jgi:hypothetical protein
VRFECVDLMDLPADFGMSDYIIAHGLLSWIPQPVSEGLLAVCRERLTPQGIAYVSYNTHPGSHIRDMFRDIMPDHTRGITDPHDRARESRRIVEAIADSDASPEPLQAMVRTERDIICRKSMGSLTHDELSDDFRSLYFHEFAALAARHGLQFLFEAVYEEGQPPANVSEQAPALLDEASSKGLLAYEQCQDCRKLRRFRQSLVTHAAVALDRQAPARSLHEFHFAAPLLHKDTEQGIEFSNPLTKAAAVTALPASIAALDRTRAAWPSTVAFAQLAGDESVRQALGPSLERFFAAGLIDAHATARVCAHQLGERPEVWCYARWQAESDRVITPLTLTSVALDDTRIRTLVLLADGPRTIDQLAQEMGDRASVEQALNVTREWVSCRGDLGRELGPSLPAPRQVQLHARRPVMRLGLAGAAPGVERVVHHQAVAQHLVVVGKDVRQAERDRIQAGRLRRQVQPRGVGAPHDGG